MAKNTTEPIQFTGGINAAIGPTEYGSKLYSEMDNIKPDINGVLKRDKGYTSRSSVGVVGDRGNYMPADYTIDSINYMIRETSSGAVGLSKNFSSGLALLGNVDGVTITDRSLRTIDTPKSIYILSKNNKNNRMYKWNPTINYYPLSGLTEGKVMGAAQLNTDYGALIFQPTVTLVANPKLLPGTTYRYTYTLVSDTGAESLPMQSSGISLTQTGANFALSIYNFNEFGDGFGGILTTAFKYLNVYRTKANPSALASDGSETATMYFVVQIPLDDVMATPDGTAIYIDNTPDTELVAPLEVQDLLIPSGTEGIYENNRLHICADPTYPNLVYVSDAIEFDNFRATTTVPIPNATIDNPTNAISSINGTIFVFNKKFGVTKLMPTSSAEQPYVVQTCSTAYGCDSGTGIVSVGGLIYFIFNKHLYATDGTNFIDIGTPIQDYLDLGTSDIRLTYNVAKECIYINCKGDYYSSKALCCYLTKHKCFTTESIDLIASGDRLGAIDDIVFNKTTGKTTIMGSTGQDVYLLTESDDYLTPVGFSLNAAQRTIVRQANIEKPLYDSTKSRLNKITCYGLGTMNISFKCIGESYSNPIDGEMLSHQGVDVPINIDAEVYYVRFSFIDTLDAMLDYWTATLNPLSKQGKQRVGGYKIDG